MFRDKNNKFLNFATKIPQFTKRQKTTFICVQKKWERRALEPDFESLTIQCIVWVQGPCLVSIDENCIIDSCAGTMLVIQWKSGLQACFENL